MSERPAIFSAPMLRALLDGRKTQTRRVLKHPLTDGFTDLMIGVNDKGQHYIGATNPHGLKVAWNEPPWAPYAPGDRLWVREAHAFVPPTAYHRSPGVEQRWNPADDYQAAVYRAGWERSKPGRWRPSIHMPRWASRLTLLVTDVRVERVQEISEADARAEGAEQPKIGTARNPFFLSYRSGFADLWDSIHGPDAWDRNDWVAAVTFTVEQKNIDA